MKLLLAILLFAFGMPLSSAETIRAKGGEAHHQHEFQRRLPKRVAMALGEKKTFAFANLLVEYTYVITRMHTPNVVRRESRAMILATAMVSVAAIVILVLSLMDVCGGNINDALGEDGVTITNQTMYDCMKANIDTCNV